MARVGGGLRPVRAARAAANLVRGSLDKELIHRVIRMHLGEIRYCYERLLLSQPAAQGMVTVQLVIGASGAVSAASVSRSTVAAGQPLEQCLTRGIKRWRFPRPKGGGVVMVSYPFVFKFSS